MADVPTPPPANETKILRVRGGTDCNRLATAIAGYVERAEHEHVAIEYVGAGAGNQAIKACIIANTLLARRGKVLTFLPVFQKGEFKDNPNAVAVQLRVRVTAL
jgi:stage V sporulation protein SpoVS